MSTVHIRVHGAKSVQEARDIVGVDRQHTQPFIRYAKSIVDKNVVLSEPVECLTKEYSQDFERYGLVFGGDDMSPRVTMSRFENAWPGVRHLATSHTSSMNEYSVGRLEKILPQYRHCFSTHTIVMPVFDPESNRLKSPSEQTAFVDLNEIILQQHCGGDWRTIAGMLESLYAEKQHIYLGGETANLFGNTLDGASATEVLHEATRDFMSKFGAMASESLLFRGK